jgi:hypothetical protein
MMDHRVIFDSALRTLRKQLNDKPIGYNLLPEKFTMPELQKLYEIILNKKIKSGFYKKMLRYDILSRRVEKAAHIRLQACIVLIWINMIKP